MSSITSFETSSHGPETKYAKMKKIVPAIQEYLETRTKNSLAIISGYLQGLAATIDISIFDPHTSLAAEFFVSLYQLMNKMEQRCSFIWHCVDVLGNACRNPAARDVLIHTYQFLPSLSRLLGDQLSEEKKIRLLKLMQELSCGIKISWQIPHLPHLMSTLTKWVESQNEEIVILSLGVLVNLCYKNLPAVYTLSRCVDIKRFLRICVPLQGPIAENHTCKLVIILDHMNGDVPKATLLKLVDVTFKSMVQAFRDTDAMMLRQITEFFLDVKKQNREAQFLKHYEHYYEQVEKLIQAVENIPSDCGDTCRNIYADPACMALIFEFLHSLIELRLQELHTFYPIVIRMALNWIQTDVVSSQALAVLRTIAIDPDVENKTTLLEPLVMGLPIYKLILCSQGDDGMPTHIEHNKKVGSLLQLLRAMVQVETVREKVIEEVKLEMVYKVFVPLLGENESPRARANGTDTCSTEAVNLYVNAIALVNELAKYNSNWIQLQNNLSQHRQIHIVLAQALYTSSADMKSIVLEMSSAPSFPIKLLAETMTNMHSMMQVDPSTSKSKVLGDLHFPVLSVGQIARLDEVLHDLKEAINEKNFLNVSTSDVMELYEYKLASMGHAERAAMASVEAASERCTHLQHRTAQLTAELNRLHQLLFHTQQCQEQAIKTKEELLISNKELEGELAVERGKYISCSSQLHDTEKILADCTLRLEETSNNLKDITSAKADLDEKHNKLKEILTELKENSAKLEKMLHKKEDELRKANQNIANLRLRVNELENQLRVQQIEMERTMIELQEITKELVVKREIIETITKVASSK